jgi:Sulfotransferase family
MPVTELPSPGLSARDDTGARGLFVVGHARSGTTVLQRAMNACPDIFMFGEANFHTPREPGAFARWYNQMHIAFENAPAKGDRCPEYEGDVEEVLAELRKRYRWVGDKVAFRDDSLGYDFDASLRYLVRRHTKSTYLCTLRHPVPTIASNREMFAPQNLQLYVLSCAKALGHLCNVYLSFDRALIVHYETISARTFTKISAYLDVDLGEAYGEYDPAIQIARTQDGVLDLPPEAQRVVAYYEDIAGLIDPDLRISQRAKLRRLQRELATFVTDYERAPVEPAAIDRLPATAQRN